MSDCHFGVSPVNCSTPDPAGTKGHLCLRHVFSLITKNMIRSFDFALSLLLTNVVYMKTMCDRQWFT